MGVCGGGCTEDADGDGICDTEDDCVGEYDFCGVCNGPGPILGCGCEDIPDGYCDCSGNVLDAVGTCGGACQNDFNGDGICDDDSIPGCTYEVACNYDPSASINDGSCLFNCYGCTDPIACNYTPSATIDNGICWYPEASYDCGLNCLIDTDADGVCDDLEVFGCTDLGACNFEPAATELDDSCSYPGCTDSTACNFEPEAGCDDGSCAADGEVGCTDEAACNFNPNAICSIDDCLYVDICGICGGPGIEGCTNPLADNFDPMAGCDDFSCLVSGCTLQGACNYEPTANVDDASCEFECAGCLNPNAINYNPFATESIPEACIFLPQEEVNTGTCGGIAIYSRHGGCSNNWDGVDPMCIANDVCHHFGYSLGALHYDITTDGSLEGTWNLGEFNQNGNCSTSYWDFCYSYGTDACSISHGVYNITCRQN